MVTEGALPLAEQLPPLPLTLTIAESLFVVSATLVATTLCVPLAAGAVYRPVLEMVPAAELPPTIPSTDQVTAVFDVFSTVAENCCVAPGSRLALLGLTATDTGPVPVPETVMIEVLLKTAPELSQAFAVMLCEPPESVSRVLS
jgi:hypothetical protein